LGVQIPSHGGNYSTLDCKKINKAPSVRIVVIFSNHQLLWRDSYEGVDGALTIKPWVLNNQPRASFFIF